MEKITDIKIIQGRLLDIAKVVSTILENHHITPILAYGSLLGAVRHKGFIPWDDDMDFYVPYAQYDLIKTILSKELPPPYRLLSFPETENYYTPFLKVEDMRTLVDEKSLYGKTENKFGLTLDLFPLSCVCSNDFNIRKIWMWMKIQRVIFTRDIYKRNYILITKFLLRIITPFRQGYCVKKIYELTAKLKKGDNIFSIWGYMDKREMLPVDYFEHLRKYKFEDSEFYGPDDYDTYLRCCYGNYMTLPPEKEREYHADNVFIK